MILKIFFSLYFVFHYNSEVNIFFIAFLIIYLAIQQTKSTASFITRIIATCVIYLATSRASTLTRCKLPRSGMIWLVGRTPKAGIPLCGISNPFLLCTEEIPGVEFKSIYPSSKKETTNIEKESDGWVAYLLKQIRYAKLSVLFESDGFVSVVRS